MMLIISTVYAEYAENKSTMIGDDVYVTGRIIDVESSPDDVFAAGQSLYVNSDITGNAYLAARDINIEGNVGENLYAAGQSILLKGQVLKDINLAAESVVVSSPVGDDLRVAANSVKINNTVGGDLIVAAKNVEIKDNIQGSVVLAVENLTFSSNARIQGWLTLYSDKKENLNIPANVIPAERIHYRTFDKMGKDFRPRKHKHWVGNIAKWFFLSIIIFATVVFFRKKILNAYERGINSSNLWSNLGYGFLSLSILIGGVIVCAITLIGLPLSILLLLATIIIWLLGYWLGNYFLIVRIWRKWRNQVPDTTRSTLVISSLAAASSLLIVNIPWVGWCLMIAITLFSIGALVPWRGVKIN